jgi:predicted alpha/beta superfamily hydrolase
MAGQDREGAPQGTVERHADFPSKLVAPRHVDVWLPPGYAKDAGRRYPVLYMHDGQNLFDPKTAYGGVTWGIGETMARLIAARKVVPAIVVGIWNTAKRYEEYYPRKAADALAPADREKLDQKIHPLLADDYLSFIVTELKPFIDRTYRTRPDRKHTRIMGSSMGGLISLYALEEYPDVFGGAGCVSTHWPIVTDAGVDFLGRRLPDPKTHRIYFDFGTRTLDEGYEPFQQRMDAWMAHAGYQSGRNWLTRKFPGDEHSEKSWRQRVNVPLEFLLKK